MSNWLYIVGGYGPFVMVLITITWISFKNNFLMMLSYISGIVGNSLLNDLLKIIIRQPRPSKGNDFRGAHKYGMPSGHAQASFFTTGLVWAWSANNGLPFLFLLMSLLISYQRIAVNVHTVEQIVAGSIVGFLLACIFVYMLARNEIVWIENRWVREQLSYIA